MPADEYTELFDTLLKDTSPQLPGAQRSVIDRELRLVTREFFNRSYAWTEMLQDLNVAAGEVATALNEGDAEAEVIGVLDVAFNGRGLTPMPKRPAEADVSGNSADAPQYWYMHSVPDEIMLYPFLATAQTGLLTVEVALTPVRSQTKLPRQVTHKYYDALVDGLLARMFSHPNKPYTDHMLAGQHRHNFLRRVGYYAGQRKQGFIHAPNWRYGRGWNVRRLGGNG